MEPEIANLVDRYEGGKLTRRELIAGLAALAASPVGALAAAPSEISSVSVNHIAVTVGDIGRSVDWYQNLFGLSVIKQEKQVAILGLHNAGINGTRFIFRPGPKPGVITHFMLGIDHFRAGELSAELKRHGLDPRADFTSFHVKDPDGLDVQVGDKNMRPENLS